MGEWENEKVSVDADLGVSEWVGKTVGVREWVIEWVLNGWRREWESMDEWGSVGDWVNEWLNSEWVKL